MRMLPEPAVSPDDDTIEVAQNWTPEQQIAHMLDLCEAQMESALTESDQAVDALIKAFTAIAETTLPANLPPEALTALDSATAEASNSQADSLRDKVAAAVIAFQFYDKLTQRLGHVRYSLSTLAMFVCDRNQTGQREQWQRLFGTLRRLYRTEEEREIFQLMVEGSSAEDARAQVAQHTTDESSAKPGEIELF